VASLPESLRAALEDALAGMPPRELARSVALLTDRYRSGREASAPILSSAADAAAYAAYRMPATYAATRAALRQFSALATGFRPRTQLDVGGGTGAAVWAAAGLWPSLERIEVLERVPRVIELGKRLAAAAPSVAIRSATWHPFVIGSQPGLWRQPGPGHQPDPGHQPHPDLATMSYVLGELPEAVREGVIIQLAARAAAVALVEPGTPAGYARVLAARATMIEAGLTIIAPCPHDLPCPIPPGQDWCHFAARINRTSVHRRLKGGSLGHEDEKFSYVVAARSRWPRAENRVLRHPRLGKGAVSMTLCTAEPGLATTTVFRRDKDLYRQARDAAWGDQWPRVGVPPLADGEVDSLG
jgi:ribosomal protein RSM22 (predicted rRNA methylase)